MIVEFKFKKGQTETIDLDNPSLSGFAMEGVIAHQEKSTDPEQWMDDFNQWDSSEGNTSVDTHGECIGFKIL